MRCWIAAASIALFSAASPAADTADAADDLVSRGEQIYHNGLLASGERLQARVQGDVPISGEQLTCTQCHRRSGYGSSESGRRIPAISANVLFTPKTITRRELYASREVGAGTRPAYTDESLIRAIRDGIDAAGRRLDPSMPRFSLPDEEMQALLAYLKTLSAEVDPGVSDTELHIATLIGPQVEPQRREAMLRLMETFITAKNSGTRLEQRRAAHTPWQKEASYPAYRQWVLHPWRLEGEAETWPQQLQRYYEVRPVFAVVGGVVDGDFQPIADFCNSYTLPCLFPSSSMPAKEPGYYTLHFNEGRRLEARTLARHLQEEGLLKPEVSLLQLYRNSDTTGAEALHQALEGNTTLKDISLSQHEHGAAWQRAKTADVLVLWLEPADLGALATLPRPWPQRIYIQSTLDYALLHELPAELRSRIHLLYPYALPQEAATQRLRVQAWLRLKGIEFDSPRVQADNYFALTLLLDTMHQLRLNFSRNYAIEVIEHMLDSALFTSLYPQFSLAPGQRYASKGCYVVRLAETETEGVVAASRWIVP